MKKTIENLRLMIYNEHGASPVTLLDNLEHNNPKEFEKIIKDFIKKQETHTEMNNIVSVLYQISTFEKNDNPND